MLNLSPSDKKLLALLLLVFAIILSVIVLDFVLNTQVFFKSASNIDMSEWENNIQEILEGPKNTQPAMIRKALHNFFDLMNDKNYEELYLLLSKDFKKNKFKDDFELFSKAEFVALIGNKCIEIETDKIMVKSNRIVRIIQAIG